MASKYIVRRPIKDTDSRVIGYGLSLALQPELELRDLELLLG